MKRVLSLILAITLALSTLTACSLKSFSFDDNNGTDYITRIQWAELLGVNFGMDSCLNSAPYFTDVSSSSPAFAYVQSCTEWGVFDLNQAQFNPDDYATVAFVVESAMNAAEIKRDDKLAYAAEHGMIADASDATVTSRATFQFAYNCVTWAVELYQNRDFVEYENVVLNSEVIDATEEDITIAENGFYAEDAEYSVGDVVIAPATADNPSGVAMKIVDITTKDDEVYYKTEEPELGEVYDEFEVAAHVVPSIADVQTAEGITVTSGGAVSPMVTNGATGITTLAYMEGSGTQSPALAKSQGIDLSFSINLTKGKIDISPAWNTSYGQFMTDISLSKDDLEDIEEAGRLFSKTNYLYYHDENGHERKLYAENKFTGGYEITGTFSLKNLYVDIECKTKKVLGIPYGIKYLSKEINCEVESSLAIKGTLSNNLKICTIPIAVGPTGLTVELQCVLYVDVSGELSVKLNISNNTTVVYNNGSTKKTSTTDVSTEAEGCITIEAGPAIGAELKALGISLVDASIKTGVELEFSATLSKMKSENVDEEAGVKTTTDGYVFAASGILYYPIITVSIGTSDSLAKKVGIAFSWKMCDKKGGLMTSQRAELFNKEWVLFQETTTEEIEAGEVSEPAETPDPDEENSEIAYGESLMIDKYFINLEKDGSAKISVTTLPEKYSISDFTFVSTNETVATVDNAGNITAIGNGTATIKVISKDGKYSADCSLTVSDDEISFTPI